MAAFIRHSPPVQQGETHIEVTDARQGRWGRHMFWVLVASTILAVIALFGSWALSAGDLAEADAKNSPTAAEARVVGAPVV
ncbi:MAG: hypothetical protein Q7T19_16420 [Caulobacter sp.]|nr:hypothetical protein [Caulobacter sp.]